MVLRCGKRQVYSKANVLRVSLLIVCALQLWVTAILPREASRESKVVRVNWSIFAQVAGLSRISFYLEFLLPQIP